MFAKRPVKYKSKVNLAGTYGWYRNLKYNLERYLYLLHRVTGIGVFAYFMMHIFVTSSRMYGREVYEAVHGLVSNPYTDFGLFLVMVGIIFHGLNGLRLIIQEYGFLLGKPIRPEYPYRIVLSTRKPRLLVLLMIAVGVVLVVTVAYELLHVWGVV